MSFAIEAVAIAGHVSSQPNMHEKLLKVHCEAILELLPIEISELRKSGRIP
jgi:hypothetical protein